MANIKNVYDTSPTTTFQVTDLMYLGRSPYGITSDFAFQYGSLIPLTNKGDLFAYSTTNFRLAVGGTNGQILQVASGATAGLAWSTASYPVTTTANQILYSSATNTISGISTGNNGVLITSAVGVPSISSTLPSTVQANITTLGAITSGTWNSTVIAAGYGGTGVSNSFNITLGGTITTAGPLTTVGSSAATFNFTGPTNVTFPTSGTLATTAGLSSTIQGTANQVLVNGTSGSPQSGPIILTTPQNIGTGNIVTFNGSIMQGNFNAQTFTGYNYQNIFTPTFLAATNANLFGAAAIYISNTVTLGANAALEAAYGIFVNNTTLMLGTGASLTSAYGIYIDDPLVGATHYALGLNGNVQFNYCHYVESFQNVSDTNYAIDATLDCNIAYRSITAARIVTLPAISSLTVLNIGSLQGAFMYVIKDESGSCSGSNTITITCTGSDTIDGASTSVINTAYGVKRIYVRPDINKYFTY